MKRRGLNFRKAFVRWLLPGLRRTCSPRAIGRVVGDLGRREYRWDGRVRWRIDRAVERASRSLNRDWTPQRLGPDLAGNLARWRMRDMLLDGLSEEQIREVCEVRGLDALDESLQLGRGIVLLGNHYGANLVPAHWLLRFGYELRLFIERPRNVSRLLRDHAEQGGPLGQAGLFVSRKGNDPQDAARALLKATKVLRAGMIVMIANDIRWEGPHAVEVPFLNRTYRLAATWVKLAKLSGAQVVQTFCTLNPDGSLSLEFLPGFDVPRERPDLEVVRHSLIPIEERVLDHPDNSNEYFFWDEPIAAALAE